MTEQSNMNIYQRINAVMKDIEYVKRGSAGQGTGVLYDVLISEIRESMVKHGIVVVTEKAGESRSRLTKKEMYVYECDFNVHYVNIDNPQDKFTTLIESHAMDSGDKATGKAITYAAKISLLKVFSLETGENDESRAESQDVSIITEEKALELESRLVETAQDGSVQWTQKANLLFTKYKISHPRQLKLKKLDAFEKDLGA